MSATATTKFTAIDPLNIDLGYSDDELAVRDSVRGFLAEHVTPHIADWFEEGGIPIARDLFKQFGQLGVLGMHLDGYGCGGASSVHYGLASLELEACDSGIRSMVSVQGSLAMFSIYNNGSEEQKNHWLPSMAEGTTVGCFGLTEPDAGSDPASMKTRARRDGDDWILDGRKMWITNAPIADVAVVWAQTDLPDGGVGVRGFIVPTDTPGVSTPEIKHKASLRASTTGEIVLDNVRLPADALMPGNDDLHKGRGIKAPLSSLSEARYGIIWGSIGAARTAWQAALDYATQRTQFGKPIAGFQLTQTLSLIHI